MASRRTGFTLIELLVVIAIIAILAAILFPVFARAKAKAQETQCLSNVKQLATAVLTYASDYDSSLPWVMYGSSSDIGNITHAWVVLRPYFKTTDILQCPTAPDAIPFGDLTDVSWLSSSYSLNGAWLGDMYNFSTSCRPAKEARGYCKFGWHISGVGGDPWPTGSSLYGTQLLDKCDDPSGQYMLWDAEMDASGCTGAVTSIGDLQAHYSCGSNRLANLGGNSCATIKPVLRHNNGLNVAFFDGHAKRQSKAETTAWAPSASTSWPWP